MNSVYRHLEALQPYVVDQLAMYQRAHAPTPAEAAEHRARLHQSHVEVAQRVMAEAKLAAVTDPTYMAAVARMSAGILL